MLREYGKNAVAYKCRVQERSNQQEINPPPSPMEPWSL